MGFVILSTQRSGTHFLSSLMGSCERVAVLGEALSRKGKYSYLAALQPDSQGAGFFERLRSDSRFRYSNFASFAGSRARLMKENCTEIGVILMYNQLDKLPDEFISDLWTKNQIIHLVRHNILRTYVSNFVNNNRIVPTHTRVVHEDPTFVLPVDDLLMALEQREEQIKRARTLVEQQGGLEVSYEELSSKTDDVMMEVANYIGLPTFTATTNLVRTNPGLLKSKILNFSEVEETLRGSKFEPMLQE